MYRRRQWHPTPVLLPGKSHGQRSLVGCRPWGREESDTTEWLRFHFSLSCIGEGNGNPFQCFCLENPRDGGAWWAAVNGVPQSRTWLKRLAAAAAVYVLLYLYISKSNTSHYSQQLLGQVFTHAAYLFWAACSAPSTSYSAVCMPVWGYMQPYLILLRSTENGVFFPTDWRLWQPGIKQVYWLHFSNRICPLPVFMYILVILIIFQTFPLYWSWWSVVFDVATVIVLGYHELCPYKLMNLNDKSVCSNCSTSRLSYLLLFGPPYSLRHNNIEVSPTNALFFNWKRPWCWERLKARREGNDRERDGWTASLTQQIRVWASSRRWWRTGKPGVLQSMGLQKVTHDWATEQQSPTMASKCSSERNSCTSLTSKGWNHKAHWGEHVSTDRLRAIGLWTKQSA